MNILQKYHKPIHSVIKIVIFIAQQRLLSLKLVEFVFGIVKVVTLLQVILRLLQTLNF